MQFDQSMQIPYLSQWFGYWFMEPERGAKLLRFVQSLNLSMHLQQVQVRQMEDDEPPRRQPPASSKWSGSFSATNRETVEVNHGYDYEILDGVAMADISGKMMKHEASGDTTSTVMMRQTIRRMTSDERVKCVLLRIDSPGGTVAGAYDLASDISMLSGAKPCYAFIEDLGASAAYLQAVQTRSISANGNAEVGSIGTVGVVYDQSAAAAMQGVRVHLLRGQVGGKPAPMKGAGTPGSEITADQLARWQEEIDDLNEGFLAAVEKGRKMTRPQVEAVADGGIWIAGKAKKLGLIDRVESLDALYARARAEVNPPNSQQQPVGARRQETEQPRTEQPQAGDPIQSTIQTPTAEAAAAGGGARASDAATGAEANSRKETGMNNQAQPNPAAPATNPATSADSGPKAATIEELQTSFPNHPAFALECAKGCLTLVEAKGAFADVLGKENAALTAKNAELEKTGKTAAGASPGLRPIASPPVNRSGNAADAGAEEGSANERFAALVQAQVAKGMPRAKAVSKIAKENPELQAEVVSEANPGRKFQAAKDHVGRIGVAELA
jgi:protease-4